jgi:hypothetical protein
VYFPGFEFSNSIKSVAPALSPGFGYDDLDGVADGSAAAGAYLQIAAGTITEAVDIRALRTALLAYCQRDTQAMVEVHRVLMQLASKPSAVTAVKPDAVTGQECLVAVGDEAARVNDA